MALGPVSPSERSPSNPILAGSSPVYLIRKWVFTDKTVTLISPSENGPFEFHIHSPQGSQITPCQLQSVRGISADVFARLKTVAIYKNFFAHAQLVLNPQGTRFSIEINGSSGLGGARRRSSAQIRKSSRSSRSSAEMRRSFAVSPASVEMHRSSGIRRYLCCKNTPAEMNRAAVPASAEIRRSSRSRRSSAETSSSSSASGEMSSSTDYYSSEMSRLPRRRSGAKYVRRDVMPALLPASAQMLRSSGVRGYLCCKNTPAEVHRGFHRGYGRGSEPPAAAEIRRSSRSRRSSAETSSSSSASGEMSSSTDYYSSEMSKLPRRRAGAKYVRRDVTPARAVAPEIRRSSGIRGYLCCENYSAEVRRGYGPAAAEMRALPDKPPATGIRGYLCCKKEEKVDDVVVLFSTAERSLSPEEAAKLRVELDKWDRKIASLPDNIDARLERGRIRMQLQMYELALQDFDRVIHLDASQDTAYGNRGLANYYLGKLKEAIRDYNKAIKLNNRDPVLYNNRGEAKADLMDDEGAIKDLTRAIELEPSAARFTNRAEVYRKLEEYSKAERDCEEALKLDVNFADAYIKRGACAFDQEDYEGALRDFEQAIKIDPNMTFAHIYKTRILEKMGRLNDALFSIEERSVIPEKDLFKNQQEIRRKLQHIPAASSYSRSDSDRERVDRVRTDLKVVNAAVTMTFRRNVYIAKAKEAFSREPLLQEFCDHFKICMENIMSSIKTAGAPGGTIEVNLKSSKAVKGIQLASSILAVAPVFGSTAQTVVSVIGNGVAAVEQLKELQKVQYVASLTDSDECALIASYTAIFFTISCQELHTLVTSKKAWWKRGVEKVTKVPMNTLVQEAAEFGVLLILDALMEGKITKSGEPLEKQFVRALVNKLNDEKMIEKLSRCVGYSDYEDPSGTKHYFRELFLNRDDRAAQAFFSESEEALSQFTISDSSSRYSEEGTEYYDRTYSTAMRSISWR